MGGSHRTIAAVSAGVLAVAAAAFLTGCAGGGTPADDRTNEGEYQVHAMHMADPDTRPPAYSSAPELTRLYTFAYEHPEVLSYIPCTCGCGPMGHMSNWNCYVKGIDASGVVTFDPHATACTICQEITADVVALWERGSPLSEIRGIIDASYPGVQTPTEYPGT